MRFEPYVLMRGFAGERRVALLVAALLVASSSGSQEGEAVAVQSLPHLSPMSSSADRAGLARQTSRDRRLIDERQATMSRRAAGGGARGAAVDARRRFRLSRHRDRGADAIGSPPDASDNITATLTNATAAAPAAETGGSTRSREHRVAFLPSMERLDLGNCSHTIVMTLLTPDGGPDAPKTRSLAHQIQMAMWSVIKAHKVGTHDDASSHIYALRLSPHICVY